MRSAAQTKKYSSCLTSSVEVLVSILKLRFIWLEILQHTIDVLTSYVNCSLAVMDKLPSLAELRKFLIKLFEKTNIDM